MKISSLDLVGDSRTGVSETLATIDRARLAAVQGALSGCTYVASDSPEYKSVHDAGKRAAKSFFSDPLGLAAKRAQSRAAGQIVGKPAYVAEVPFAGSYLCEAKT